MEEQSQVTEAPNISLQDLVILLNLVKVVADRGAIKAEEMSTVGAVYEKLFGFLKSSGALKTPEPTNEQPAQDQ